MNDECSICLDDIDVKVTGCTEMACGHKFHLGCIGKWLSGKDSCPLCRTAPKEKEKLFSGPTTRLRFQNMFNLMVNKTNTHADEFHASINSDIDSMNNIIPDNNSINHRINHSINNNINNAINYIDALPNDILPNDINETERDIRLVMTQSGVNNRPLVVEILAKNHGDIINTIIELTSPPFVDG